MIPHNVSLEVLIRPVSRHDRDAMLLDPFNGLPFARQGVTGWEAHDMPQFIREDLDLGVGDEEWRRNSKNVKVTLITSKLHHSSDLGRPGEHDFESRVLECDMLAYSLGHADCDEEIQDRLDTATLSQLGLDFDPEAVKAFQESHGHFSRVKAAAKRITGLSTGRLDVGQPADIAADTAILGFYEAVDGTLSRMDPEDPQAEVIEGLSDLILNKLKSMRNVAMLGALVGQTLHEKRGLASPERPLKVLAVVDELSSTVATTLRRAYGIDVVRVVPDTQRIPAHRQAIFRAMTPLLDRCVMTKHDAEIFFPTLEP